MTEYKSEVLGN